MQFHVGTAAVPARVALLEYPQLAPGQAQMAQLRLAERLPIAPWDRFVLRANLPATGQSGLTTIGGGRILNTSNVKLRRNRPWTIAALRARLEAIDEPTRWIELMLQESDRPLTLAALQRKCLFRREEIAPVLTQLCASGRLVRTPSGNLVHQNAIERAAAKILRAVTAFHSARPQLLGLGRSELMAQVECNAELFELALENLLGSNRLEKTGAVFAVSGWRARLTDRDRWLAEQLETAFEKGRWLSPTTAELAASLTVQVEEIEKAIKLLIDRGVLVGLNDKIVMHRNAIEVGKQVALDLFRRNPSFTTMQFRDALGVSRKYAVPLLDYLDRIKFTVRAGNIRTPGADAKKLLQKELSHNSGSGDT